VWFLLVSLIREFFLPHSVHNRCIPNANSGASDLPQGFRPRMLNSKHISTCEVHLKFKSSSIATRLLSSVAERFFTSDLDGGSDRFDMAGKIILAK